MCQCRHNLNTQLTYINITMKHLFLFFAFLSVFTVETYAQAEYKSLESFNNDTLKYIRYNFEENKQRYIGQAYSKLIKEFELTPYYDKTFKWREPDKSKIWGVRIAYFPDMYVFFFNKKHLDDFLYIDVEFEKEYLRSTADLRQGLSKGTPHYLDHLFEGHIIKNIKVRTISEVIKQNKTVPLGRTITEL